jgi:hypothetical protein
MPDKDEKVAKRPAPQKGKRPGPATDDLAFGDIIDAILDADPEAVREHRQKRRKRSSQPLKK